MKNPQRTKEEARKLVEEVWRKYKDDQTDENWRALQTQHNEDSSVDAYKVYDTAIDSLVDPFKNCAKATKPNFARICESQFGYHLIRREK
jgi:uncharacterized protein YpuA (DUF1002 family)